MLLRSGFEIEKIDAVGRPIRRIGVHTIMVKDGQRFAVCVLVRGVTYTALTLQAIDTEGNDAEGQIVFTMPSG